MIGLDTLSNTISTILHNACNLKTRLIAAKIKYEVKETLTCKDDKNVGARSSKKAKRQSKPTASSGTGSARTEILIKVELLFACKHCIHLTNCVLHEWKATGSLSVAIHFPPKNQPMLTPLTTKAHCIQQIKSENLKKNAGFVQARVPRTAYQGDPITEERTIAPASLQKSTSRAERNQTSKEADPS
jgi:hypothetical protein